MALDRWIAFFLLLAFAIYGYTAFFMMDDLLPPIMQRNPIWPSSFPKVLAVGGIITALIVLSGFEKSSDPNAADINYRRLQDYKIGQALALLGLMVVYALVLRPVGFLAATFLFLAIGSIILGERRYVVIAIVSATAAGGVWYLVNVVLGIFLTPLPAFL
ncbi:MAG: tripartite tricarboxylate transporter TctB family protein [Pseudomonadota bacterium]